MRSKSRIKKSTQCARETNEFTTAVQKKLTDQISDFTLPTLFEENTTWTVFIQYQNIQNEHLQLSEKAVKTVLPSPTTFSSVWGQLSFVYWKHHVTIDWMQKQIRQCSCLKQCHFYHWYFFLFGKNSYFHKNILLMFICNWFVFNDYLSMFLISNMVNWGYKQSTQTISFWVLNDFLRV